MSTFTPDYNLEKPSSSDAFGDFLASYNSNMDIIDQNLGGGGGGGTTTDIFSIFDSCRLSQRYNTGAIADGEFTFSIDENANDWSSNVTATNTTAIDLTDYEKLRLVIEISDRSDYGYFYVTLSQTTYTWADYVWPSVYANENSILKIDSSGTYDIDVTLLTGNYYIYIGATTGKDTTASGDCNNSHNGKIVGAVSSFVAIAPAGGSSVVPNPVGTPTDDLNTVEINGTIYAIPGSGGGGGGSGYKADVLVTGIGDLATVNLAHPITDYDQIMLIGRSQADGAESRLTAVYDVKYIRPLIGTSTKFGVTSNDWFLWYSFSDASTMQKSANSWIWLETVIGIKYQDGGGGGGGAGAVKHEIIHQTNVAIYDNTQIVLDLQNKYTDPVVFAENPLPLSQWGGIIVVQAPTLVYDSANDTLTFNVYTNTGQTYGYVDWVVMDKVSSGGGGSYSIEYSTSEREVGKWIDGRSVFEKTIDLTSLACASQSWTDTGISKGAIDIISHSQVFGDDGTFYGCTNVNITTNTDHIGIFNESGASITVRYLVVQYVKRHNLHTVEYIEGTGTQWLTTGITPDLTTVLKAGIMPTENTGEVLIGNCTDDNHDWRLFNYGGSFYYDFDGARWNGDSLGQNVYADIELGNYYAKKNGVTVYTGSTQTNLGAWSSNDIYFLYKQDNQRISKARLYYLKIYKNGNLVFDAIPVKDSNDVPCLFDFISGNYIYNSGMGDFVAGPDV